MNTKKFFLCFLILIYLFNLYPSNVIKLVKMKMTDGSKRNSQILYCGKSGLIVWNSYIPYNKESINKYAEYIPYNKIKRIQVDNYISFLPLAFGFYTGAGLAILQFMQKTDTAEGAFYKGIGAVIVFTFSITAGALGTAISILIPRNSKANEFSNKKIARKGYIMFKDDIPPEIIAMLAKYEK